MTKKPQSQREINNHAHRIMMSRDLIRNCIENPSPVPVSNESLDRIISACKNAAEPEKPTRQTKTNTLKQDFKEIAHSCAIGCTIIFLLSLITTHPAAPYISWGILLIVKPRLRHWHNLKKYQNNLDTYNEAKRLCETKQTEEFCKKVINMAVDTQAIPQEMKEGMYVC